ncbi:MAG: hypothetical protein NTX50_07050, partial [Candidatus Sumerlaeota bacterium]|nr:hypothetical protein [Candidatus Sumerlaeota bacterium]
ALARYGRPTERGGLPFGANLDRSCFSSPNDKGLLLWSSCAARRHSPLSIRLQGRYDPEN